MPFAVLVALGVVVAHGVLLRRGAALGLDVAVMNRMVAAAIAAGFLGAHFVKFLYNPDELVVNPAILLGGTKGISSFGGIVGGLLAAVLVVKAGGHRILDYLDVLAYAFPFGWILGRAGCVLVKDHPGVRATGWLTRDFDGVPRYDLGLVELVGFAVPMSALFYRLGGKPRPSGFFFALFLTAYGPFRVLLDALHDQPPRYGPLSVDQWFGLALTVAGFALWRWPQPATRPQPSETTKAPARH